MKKIEYQVPETEIVELKNEVALLAGSGDMNTDYPGDGGNGDGLPD